MYCPGGSVITTVPTISSLIPSTTSGNYATCIMRVICVVFSVDTRISSTLATSCSTGIIIITANLKYVFISNKFYSKQLLSTGISSLPIFHLPVQVKLQLNHQTVRYSYCVYYIVLCDQPLFIILS